MGLIANQVVERCRSTNDLIRELGEAGHPHGTWVSARAQDAGRGRLGRAWVSEPGNLFLSYLARLEDRGLWSWIPLAAGLASLEAVISLRAFPSLRLKWPNDLWIGRAKAGGLLCEGVSGPRGAFVGIGIGLNCASAPELADRETASFDFTLDEVNLLRGRLVSNLGRRLARLTSPDGIEELRQDYMACALLREGSEISWGEGETGQVSGLGASGELLVLRESGERISLFAEEVSPRLVPGASFGFPV